MLKGLAQGRLRVEPTHRRQQDARAREQRDLFEFVDPPHERRASKAPSRALFDYAAVLAGLEAVTEARKAREAR
ncbi:MAG: hypothetical protein IPJ19_18965 [Planctomycetes bacterium]|nr:hypothetical protein [Planctomycetota bacterium]